MTALPTRILQIAAGPAGAPGKIWTAPLYGEVETEQTSGGPPGKATIKLWNLAPDSLAMLASNRASMVVTAGSGVGRVMFKGELLAKDVTTKREGGDWVTQCTPRDGGRRWLEGFCSIAYRPGDTWGRILTDAIAQAGMVPGYIGPGFPAAEPCPYPWVSMGPAKRVIGLIVGVNGCAWHQDAGKVVVLSPLDSVVPAGVPLISPETGLIGSPEKVGANGVKFKCLLLPELRPGSGFVMSSRFFNGGWRATKTKNKASLDGKIWETEAEARIA